MLIAFENTISLSAQTLILSAHALIAFENRISLFARILILSAHALIVFENAISLSAHALIAFENRISLSVHTLILSAHVLIAFENTISLFAHILILSAHALLAFENLLGLSTRTLIAFAHALIVFENRISLSARTLIASTLPCDIACSPTVPGGDTPCLTAGDARRANPWTEGKAHSPTPAVSHSNPTSARLSYPSTLSVRRCQRRDQSSLPVHGFPLALLGYHPRLRMVRLRRRRYSVWMWRRCRRCSG